MRILENYNLKNNNTFGITANCKRFIIIESEKDIVDYFENHNDGRSYFILGGGSNILLKNDLDIDVLSIEIRGIKIVDDESSTISIEVNAGENWHEFVQMTVDQQYYGLENLALIPGNVGTAPIQNIGAYGVEQENYMLSLRGFNIETNKYELYFKEDCEFGYRSSLFKNDLKGKFIITSVTYKLNKFESPNLTYAELDNYLVKNKLKPNAKNIFDSVVKIRQSKLPNTNVLGNSGSFFKNPIISKEKFDDLLMNNPNLKGYPESGGMVKISAGWLIEQSGLKGYRLKDAGIYSEHALILVNHGNSTGKEIWELAQFVISQVNDKFGIELEPEVNVVG